MKTGKRTIYGKVVNTKMDKTAVVTVSRQFAHPLYKKFVTRTKKYFVHDENSVAKVGDEISLVESRPLSKRKRWRLLEVVKPA